MGELGFIAGGYATLKISSHNSDQEVNSSLALYSEDEDWTTGNFQVSE